MAGIRKASSSAAAMAMALLVVAALLLLVAVAGAAGRHTACHVDLERMEDKCGSYCAAGSREGSPSGECCDAVRGADFPCLCRYKPLLRSVAPGMDANRAMQIPAKCGIPNVPAC
ncbi:putative lipid-transfer protein DIR1 [Brachypodium distachyon]|uniref:Bifunctional inhibitor/plant lipid transfer protein/seed storage helical domain-containing protein n=1 Tax=Brachypodium distachyon TaxID=15368 RepID=I1HUI1_BRADI|nr:putative lipid-transfer protein DIR1 [Brachypodium distachyon]KQK11165.1 hypothetical protein BRADI_2g58520v3 [Brachypodium distachyon]|eukprot:XP_003564903.1 putative lipid-transfer protein DIR1 [Brachypodium distachyon]